MSVKTIKLKTAARSVYNNAKKSLIIDLEALREAVVAGESLSCIRHDCTNYESVCNKINDEELNEVAGRAIHLLQNYVNGRIDDERINFTKLCLNNMNALLKENSELKDELETLRSNFKLLLDNQAVLSDTFRAELAKAIRSKEDYVRFVELNYVRKYTNSGKLFPTRY